MTSTPVLAAVVSTPAAGNEKNMACNAVLVLEGAEKGVSREGRKCCTLIFSPE
jgi:hypothetical protein